MTETPNGLRQAADGGVSRTVLDVMGPRVEFLAAPEECRDEYCLMQCTVLPRVNIPLHSHADAESFYVTGGTIDVLNMASGMSWTTAKSGTFIQIPSNAKHAFRNLGEEPAVLLCATTARMGRFFLEIGSPIAAGQAPTPPTAKQLEKFIVTAQHYGYWLGSPEDNAEVGLFLK